MPPPNVRPGRSCYKLIICSPETESLLQLQAVESKHRSTLKIGRELPWGKPSSPPPPFFFTPRHMYRTGLHTRTHSGKHNLHSFHIRDPLLPETGSLYDFFSPSVFQQLKPFCWAKPFYPSFLYICMKWWRRCTFGWLEGVKCNWNSWSEVYNTSCVLHLANALISSADRAMGHRSPGLISSMGQGCHPNSTHTYTHATWLDARASVCVCVCVCLR